MKEYGERLKKLLSNLSKDSLVVELASIIQELIEKTQQLQLENQQLRCENQQLQRENKQLQLENQQFKTEIRQLKDEIANIKKLPPRPKITSSNLEKKTKEFSPQQRNWKKSSKNGKLVIDHTEKIELSPEQIPKAAEFKGYKSYVVQELVIKRKIVRYLLAQWQKSDGTYLSYIEHLHIQNP